MVLGHHTFLILLPLVLHRSSKKVSNNWKLLSENVGSFLIANDVSIKFLFIEFVFICLIFWFSCVPYGISTFIVRPLSSASKTKDEEVSSFSIQVTSLSMEFSIPTANFSSISSTIPVKAPVLCGECSASFDEPMPTADVLCYVHFSRPRDAYAGIELLIRQPTILWSSGEVIFYEYYVQVQVDYI